MGLIALRFYLLIPVETWFYWWIWQVFESCREKLAFDTKILLSPILLVSMTPPPHQLLTSGAGLGLWGHSQTHLLCVASLGKWKPEASQRAFHLDSGAVPGHSARPAGKSGEHFDANAQLGPVHSVFTPQGCLQGICSLYRWITWRPSSSHNIHWVLTICQLLGPGWQYTIQVKINVFVIRALLNPGSKTHCCGELL